MSNVTDNLTVVNNKPSTSDLGVWILDFKQYKENSYVFNDKVIYDEVMRSPYMANDKSYITSCLEYVLSSNSKIGEFISQFYGITDMDYSSINSLNDLSNSSQALINLYKHSYINLFIGSETFKSILSSTAQGHVLLEDETVRNYIFSNQTLYSLLFSNKGVQEYVLNNETMFRTILSSTIFSTFIQSNTDISKRLATDNSLLDIVLDYNEVVYWLQSQDTNFKAHMNSRSDTVTLKFTSKYGSTPILHHTGTYYIINWWCETSIQWNTNVYMFYVMYYGGGSNPKDYTSYVTASLNDILNKPKSVGGFFRNIGSYHNQSSTGNLSMCVTAIKLRD